MIKAIERNKANGFTLVETVMAICVLAVGLLGLATLQITAVNGNASSEYRTEASALIEDKIEDYLNTPYSGITSGTITESGTLGIFTRVSEIVSDSPVAGTKTVTVTVSWTDYTDHSVALRTIISQ